MWYFWEIYGFSETCYFPRSLQFQCFGSVYLVYWLQYSMVVILWCCLFGEPRISWTTMSVSFQYLRKLLLIPLKMFSILFCPKFLALNIPYLTIFVCFVLSQFSICLEWIIHDFLLIIWPLSERSNSSTSFNKQSFLLPVVLGCFPKSFFYFTNLIFVFKISVAWVFFSVFYLPTEAILVLCHIFSSIFYLICISVE